LKPLSLNTIRAPKRIFLGLLLAAFFFLLLLAVYLFVSLWEPDSFISQSVILVLTIFVVILLFLCLYSLTVIVLAILQQRRLGLGAWFTEKTFFLLYPLVLHLGRLLNITQDKIQRSFIEINNQLILGRSLKIHPSRILLLIPHCIQKDSCVYKITHGVENCRGCGSCQIAEIVDIAHNSGINVEVVSGGTVARLAVEKNKPHAVVAVACERDLSNGVLDSFPLPVIGVINERPEGPCFNTRVDLQSLQKAVDYFLYPALK